MSYVWVFFDSFLLFVRMMDASKPRRNNMNKQKKYIYITLLCKTSYHFIKTLYPMYVLLMYTYIYNIYTCMACVCMCMCMCVYHGVCIPFPYLEHMIMVVSPFRNPPPPLSIERVKKENIFFISLIAFILIRKEGKADIALSLSP
mgnify:CR=1 FL=1